MKVVPSSDALLEEWPNDPGAWINTTDDILVLQMPTRSELQATLRRFEEELRTALVQLFSLPLRQVVDCYGLLGLNKRTVSDRNEELFGLRPQTNSGAKGLLRIRNKAILGAMSDARLKTKARWTVDKFLGPRGLAAFIHTLPLSTQRKLIAQVFGQDRELGDVLRLGQGQKLGMQMLREIVGQSGAVETSLQDLGKWLSNEAEKSPRDCVKGISVRSFAPLWFASYLAREGIWLLPICGVRSSVSFFPRWMKPVQATISVPAAISDLSSDVMSLHLANSDQRRADKLVFDVMIKLGLCSNVWMAGKPCAGPLIGFKKFVLDSGRSKTHLSWAANRLWEAQLRHFKAAPDCHPDAHAFVLGKRLVSKGTRPFEWVHAPNSKNTKIFRRITGVDQAPSEFPQVLIDFATELESMLPLFQVEAIELKIKSLNLWLVYLATLDEPPRSLREIKRYPHIVSAPDARKNAQSFQGFLKDHFNSGNRTAIDALPTLRQAWSLAALRDGFHEALSNPIDAKDTHSKAPARRPMTVRSALAPEVADIIARENVGDDMQFARQLGGKRNVCWRRIYREDEGEEVLVFFPAAPTLVQIILKTGMRGASARWLDSGEGDEFSVNSETRASEPNRRSSAEKGRSEGFLRLCLLGDAERSTVMGFYVNSSKTGPYEVPWISEDLIGLVEELIRFQSTNFPISGPVEIDNGVGFDSRFKVSKGASFPLARDPEYKTGHPISATRLSAYWEKLLVHCQPIIDRELGYHYPVVDDDGKPLFGIHSLRVTIISTLLDHGVPVSIVQMLVGHKTPIMTLYYHDVTNSKIHQGLQQAFEQQRRRRIEDLERDAASRETLANEAITFRSEAEFVGAQMLTADHGHRMPFDIFAHGICPGGSCDIGGAKIGGAKYKPVWRPRACSACRFRITGPAFLNGLIHRANSLMWEIKESVRKERSLNAEMIEKEDAGLPVEFLRGQVRKEQSFRDELFGEWCLEFRTIEQARSLQHEDLGEPSAGAAIIVKGGADDAASALLVEGHDLHLAQRLIEDAKIVGSKAELPEGAELLRDKLLLQIAASNSIQGLLHVASNAEREEAFHQFGALLTEHVEDPDELQDLIEGTTKIADMAALASAVADAGSRLGPSSVDWLAIAET